MKGQKTYLFTKWHTYMGIYMGPHSHFNYKFISQFIKYILYTLIVYLVITLTVLSLKLVSYVMPHIARVMAWVTIYLWV